MRLLILRGTFSPGEKKIYKGLICFCHVHKTDTDQTINAAVSKIAVHLNQKEEVVIAPFSCLDEKPTTMNFDEAKFFFKRFCIKMPGSVLVPLKYPEINLNIIPPSDFVKFIEVH